MKAYIERPISEKPEKVGWYHTVGDELVAYWHGDNTKVYTKWRGWDSKITHWLQPVEIPDPSPVVNTDVLVDALRKILYMKLEEGEKDTKYAFNRCWHLANDALTVYADSLITTPQPDNKEEKP